MVDYGATYEHSWAYCGTNVQFPSNRDWELLVAEILDCRKTAMSSPCKTCLDWMPPLASLSDCAAEEAVNIPHLKHRNTIMYLLRSENIFSATRFIDSEQHFLI